MGAASRRSSSAAPFVLAIALLCSACSGVAGQATGQVMRTPDEVFRETERIAAGRPWSPETAARLTGASLQRVAAESSDLVTVFRGPSATGMFESVELRVPAATMRAQGNILILNVRPGSRVASGDVHDRMGEPKTVKDGSVHGDDPWFMIYARPWGELSFGFKNGANQELVTLVLDATGRTAP
jgi:hypothetical protein